MKKLTARMIRDQIKATCAIEGLPALHISSHSFRKAASTHMSAIGVSEVDMKEGLLSQVEGHGQHL